MLDIHKPPRSSDTKIAFSHSILPAYIDPQHPPTKKLPFSTFTAQPHTHTLDLVLPAELWDLIRASLTPLNALVYARAFLSLADILADDFLDAYIRSGYGVSMLAADAETRMHIVRGVLRIEMPRHVYERAGLVGVPVPDGGGKHGKGWWRVECDLKAASMRRGKKGFERVRWAAGNVWAGSRAWVFCSANASFGESVGEGREVLCRHAPKVFRMEPRVETLTGVVVPKLDVQGNALSGLYDRDDALALLEWLDMLGLGSPRVGDGSAVDSHLCRYDVPDFGYGVETRELVRVRWSGFITPEFVRDVFLEVWKAGFKGKRESKRRKGDGDQDGDATMQDTQNEADAGSWFSMSAHAFRGKNAWSLMQFANRETLVWQVEA